MIPKSVVQPLTPLDHGAGSPAVWKGRSPGHDAHGWRRAEQLLSYVILGCGFLTFGFGTYQIFTSHSVVPISDEWQEIDVVATAPHHRPPISWLWTQHNEHRVVFYRLLLLADIHLFHGKHWISFVSIFAVQCGFLILLARLLFLGGCGGTLTRSLTGLAAFCLFCPSQWENFMWAFQISFFLPGFFLVLALLCLLRHQQVDSSQRVQNVDLGLSILGASAATYSNGNGVVVWPILLMFAVMLGAKLKTLAIYVVAGGVLIGSYLYHYASPSYHTSPWYSVRHPLAILEYATKYMGVILPPWVKLRDLVAVSTGTFGLLAGVVAAFLVLTRFQWKKAYIVTLLGLMLFSLATALITALGRVGVGVDQAYQSRYQTFNLLFWFAVVSLWLLIADRMTPRLLRIMLASIPVVMLIAAVVLFPLCLRASRLVTQRSQAAAVTLVTGVPDKQALGRLYPPDPGIPWRDAEYFREEHLFMFSASSFERMGQPLASVYRVGSKVKCAGEVSLAEPVPVEDSLTGTRGDGMRINGEAMSGASEEPVWSLVIAASGKIAGFGVGGIELNTSGSKTFLKKAKSVGWMGFARPPIGTTLMDVYAVDNRGEELCPLTTVAVPIVR